MSGGASFRDYLKLFGGASYASPSTMNTGEKVGLA